MNKKILSIFLSLMMVFSLASYTFALDSEETVVSDEAVTEVVESEEEKETIEEEEEIVEDEVTETSEEEEIVEESSTEEIATSSVDTTLASTSEEDSTLATSSETTVSTFAELSEAIKSDATITISSSSSISLTDNLVIDYDVTLTGSGTLKLAGKYTITVNEGATLTINGIKIDGNSTDYDSSTIKFLIVKGTLNFAGGYIKNFTNDVSISGQSKQGIIFIDGGTFNMSKGYIYSNSFTVGETINNQQDSIIYIDSGTFNFSGGYIGNTTNYYNDLGTSKINSFYTYNSIVTVGQSTEGSYFYMSGGYIKGNYGGPAVIVGNNSDTFTDYSNTTKFEMTGGSIYHNSGYSTSGKNSIRAYSGPVTVFNGTFNLNGGSISNNVYYQYGGGVTVIACGIANFNMYSGSIDNNTANKAGGGIYVTKLANSDSSQENVHLYGGSIYKNSGSTSGYGGGIYVVSGCTVYLENAAIYENYSSKIGGGI